MQRTLGARQDPDAGLLERGSNRHRVRGEYEQIEIPRLPVVEAERDSHATAEIRRGIDDGREGRERRALCVGDAAHCPAHGGRAPPRGGEISMPAMSDQ